MSKSSGPILVPIGFTDQSIIALEQAINIANITNSELFLLTVVEEPSAIQKLFVEYKDSLEKLKNEVRIKIEKIQETKCNVLKRDSDCMVSFGKIYEEIVRVSDMIGASLIVMGTDGTPKDKKKKFIGSNAYNVVRSAHCPVITIKGKVHRSGCKKIILPLDLHKETKEKVTTAIAYARLWNSEIHVFSVHNDNNEEIKLKLTRNLNQVKNFILDKGIKCSSALVNYDKLNLSKKVIDYSIDLNSDLIIIMTQQESDFKRYFLGSTASSIINNSDTPVMSIRPVKKLDTTSYELQ